MRTGVLGCMLQNACSAVPKCDDSTANALARKQLCPALQMHQLVVQVAGRSRDAMLCHLACFDHAVPKCDEGAANGVA